MLKKSLKKSPQRMLRKRRRRHREVSRVGHGASRGRGHRLRIKYNNYCSNQFEKVNVFISQINGEGCKGEGKTLTFPNRLILRSDFRTECEFVEEH